MKAWTIGTKAARGQAGIPSRSWQSPSSSATAAGERPEISEYTEKYPELADRFRDLVPALLMVEQLGSAEVDGAKTPAASVKAEPVRELGAPTAPKPCELLSEIPLFWPGNGPRSCLSAHQALPGTHHWTAPRRLLVEYDAAALRVAVEPVPVNDASLREDWGPRLYRVAFELESPEPKGAYTFRFRAEGGTE